MSDAPTTPQLSNRDPNARWQFLRDVAVFELKLALNNLHNFFQIPLTLVVAAIDVIAGGKTEGERFYKLVEMGRTIDDSIDIYSIIEHRERSLNKDFTVDAVIRRLEDVIVKEYAKGGTAASVKQAVDRAIDDMQSRSGDTLGKAGDAMKTAADKIHEKMQKLGDTPPASPPPQP